jgi:hypothetical protein
MKTINFSNVICVSIQLPITVISENTLNVFMKNSHLINALSAKKALVKKQLLSGMFRMCMKTINFSNVIFVSIQFSVTVFSENTLNVFMKNSNHINALFVTGALVDNHI